MGSISFAVMMSMYQPSQRMSGKSCATRRAASRKAPSVVLTTLAFVTTVTHSLAFARANSKAMRMMRSAPGSEMMRKSILISPRDNPWLPSA